MQHKNVRNKQLCINLSTITEGGGLWLCDPRAKNRAGGNLSPWAS